MDDCLVPHIMHVPCPEGQGDARVHLPASEGHLASLFAPGNGLDEGPVDDMESTPRVTVIVQLGDSPAWPRNKPSVEITGLGDQPPGPVAYACGARPVHGGAEMRCDRSRIDVLAAERWTAGSLHPKKGSD
jgi:hypothetical protein